VSEIRAMFYDNILIRSTASKYKIYNINILLVLQNSNNKYIMQSILL